MIRLPDGTLIHRKPNEIFSYESKDEYKQEESKATSHDRKLPVTGGEWREHPRSSEVSEKHKYYKKQDEGSKVEYSATGGGDRDSDKGGRAEDGVHDEDRSELEKTLARHKEFFGDTDGDIDNVDLFDVEEDETSEKAESIKEDIDAGGVPDGYDRVQGEDGNSMLEGEEVAIPKSGKGLEQREYIRQSFNSVMDAIESGDIDHKTGASLLTVLGGIEKQFLANEGRLIVKEKDIKGNLERTQKLYELKQANENMKRQQILERDSLLSGNRKDEAANKFALSEAKSRLDFERRKEIESRKEQSKFELQQEKSRADLDKRGADKQAKLEFLRESHKLKMELAKAKSEYANEKTQIFTNGMKEITSLLLGGAAIIRSIGVGRRRKSL